MQPELFIKLPFDTSSNHLLSTLDWERLSLWGKKQKVLMMYKWCIMMYKSMNDRLFSQRHSAYNLRNSGGRLTLSLAIVWLRASWTKTTLLIWPHSLKIIVSHYPPDKWSLFNGKVLGKPDLHYPVDSDSSGLSCSNGGLHNPQNKSLSMG